MHYAICVYTRKIILSVAKKLSTKFAGQYFKKVENHYCLVSLHTNIQYEYQTIRRAISVGQNRFAF